MDEERSDGHTEARQISRWTDRQLGRSDDLTMQREIVKGWMVMEERVQSHRQIIRQAANVGLLAVKLLHVDLSCLSEEAEAELSVMYTWLFDRLFNPATCCACVCVCVCTCKLSFSTLSMLPIHYSVMFV